MSQKDIETFKQGDYPKFFLTFPLSETIEQKKYKGKEEGDESPSPITAA